MANSNAKGQRVFVTNDIPVALDASDIQIGAVELKNAATDDRALVAASGGTPTFGISTLPVVANASDPSLSEGKTAYASSDLAGYNRSVLKAETSKVIGTINISAAQTLANLTAITNALPAGTNLLGKVGIDQTSAGSTNATQQKQYTGTPSNYTIATADGTVFTLAAGEVGFIQNLDSADALAVKYGASASTTSLSFILPCGSAQDDGRGGSVKIDDWVGAVSVATMTGAGRYIAWKQAP